MLKVVHASETTSGPTRWCSRIAVIIATILAPVLPVLVWFWERWAFKVVMAVELVALIDWVVEHPLYTALAVVAAALSIAVLAVRSQ